MNVLIGTRITNEILESCPPGSIFLANDSSVGVNTMHRQANRSWTQTFYDADDEIVDHGQGLGPLAPTVYKPENRLVLFLP